jgi:putative ABC transport system permease protein
VAANYFAAMGIPLVAGRSFNDDDRTEAPRVAIISEAAARRDFPYESALGKRVKYQGEWRTIIGIARDTKFDRLSSTDMPSIYTPMLQRTGVLDIVVRTVREPAAITNTVRDVVQQVGPAVAITDVQVVESLVRRSFGEETFRTALIALFAVIAALLAAVGIFGVTARAVSRRTREVGIRVALGATTRTVVGMIVSQTLSGVTIGVALGALAALPLSRLLAPYLFGVTTYDPVTYAGILALLGGVALVSSWLPARRAGRVDPAIVLRE